MAGLHHLFTGVTPPEGLDSVADNGPCVQVLERLIGSMQSLSDPSRCLCRPQMGDEWQIPCTPNCRSTPPPPNNNAFPNLNVVTVSIYVYVHTYACVCVCEYTDMHPSKVKPGTLLSGTFACLGLLPWAFDRVCGRGFKRG